ncbi:MAG TPA: sigma factor-like helix-turn-helix DNA-binding protein, partial [Thermoanaerobaculia bacterium]|nr:sigma factor-like helix-turn-helix DNA-binding protein [Thermoanaerobaculia bacterium]
EVPPGAPREPVGPEDHIRLALALTRRVFRRPTPDDFGIALLALVEAAAQWNAGKRPCRWSTFAGSRIRWELVYRYQLSSAAAIAAEVPLFCVAPDDEEAEIERPEMAVEAPALRAAEARADVEALLEGLTAGEALVLRRRFGIGGTEPLTREAVGEELGVGKERIRTIEGKALARLRRRAGRRTFTIPLDSARSERLR